MGKLSCRDRAAPEVPEPERQLNTSRRVAAERDGTLKLALVVWLQSRKRRTRSVYPKAQPSSTSIKVKKSINRSARSVLP
jgi:hypothetical protein